MKKHITIYLTLVLLPILAFGQKTDIILSKVIGKSPYNGFLAPPTDLETNPLKIPSFMNLVYFDYYSINIANAEEQFRKYKTGKINYEEYIQIVRSNTRKSIDTSILAKNVNNYKSGITYIISGIDKDSSKVFLVDVNRDGVISKDEVTVYKKKFLDSLENNFSYRDSLASFTLHQNGANKSERTLSFKILPQPYFDKYPTYRKKATSFGLIRNEYWAGVAKILNKDYNIVASSKQFANELNDLRFNIKQDTTFNKLPIDPHQEWRDKFLSLTIDSIEKISNQKIKIFINYQSPPKQEKDTTFLMSLKDVKNDAAFKFNTFLNNNKYVLIDYWGTWCKPCIENLPILQNLEKKHSNKLSIISIAYDYDINAVKKFDLEHNTVWQSCFIDRTKQQSLIQSLKVQVYPTYRLYNQKGELVFHGGTAKDLEQINEILNR